MTARRKKKALGPAVSTSMEIGGRSIRAGHRERVELEFVKLPAQARLSLPLEVLVGAGASEHTPTVWLSAAIHGDELNGVEIISRVLARLDPELMHGTVIAAPVVNIFGFALQDRYLPDRRDLNRSFPGSSRGSLAGRLANFFMTEIVERSTHGIDLHTGSNHRTNLPQIRADLSDRGTLALAEAFGAPVMVHGDAPRGSLRGAGTRRGKPTLVYEAGEPMRFDPQGIELGVDGVLRVLAALGILAEAPPSPASLPCGPNLRVEQRTWVRAHASGLFDLSVALGDKVERGQQLGTLYQPLDARKRRVKASRTGLVMGHTNNPLAYQGDALVHLGTPVSDS